MHVGHWGLGQGLMGVACFGFRVWGSGLGYDGCDFALPALVSLRNPINP